MRYRCCLVRECSRMQPTTTALVLHCDHVSFGVDSLINSLSLLAGCCLIFSYSINLLASYISSFHAFFPSFSLSLCPPLAPPKNALTVLGYKWIFFIFFSLGCFTPPRWSVVDGALLHSKNLFQMHTPIIVCFTDQPRIYIFFVSIFLLLLLPSLTLLVVDDTRIKNNNMKKEIEITCEGGWLQSTVSERERTCTAYIDDNLIEMRRERKGLLKWFSMFDKRGTRREVWNTLPKISHHWTCILVVER